MIQFEEKKWTWFNENIAYKKSNDMNVTRWKIIFNSMLREKSSTPCWGLLEMCWLNLPCRFGWLKILSFTWRFYQALKTLDLLEVVGEKNKWWINSDLTIVESVKSHQLNKQKWTVSSKHMPWQINQILCPSWSSCDHHQELRMPCVFQVDGQNTKKNTSWDGWHAGIYCMFTLSTSWPVCPSGGQ